MHDMHHSSNILRFLYMLYEVPLHFVLHQSVKSLSSVVRFMFLKSNAKCTWKFYREFTTWQHFIGFWAKKQIKRPIGCCLLSTFKTPCAFPLYKYHFWFLNSIHTVISASFLYASPSHSFVFQYAASAQFSLARNCCLIFSY